jgi:hypothetical protein
MAQTNFTPISLYYSSTASAVPTAGNLVAGELAINTLDGKLFYKDSSGVVQTLASKGTGTIGGSTTQVQYNNAGAFAGSANMTFNGTNLTLLGGLGVGASPTAGTTLSVTKNITGAINSYGVTSSGQAQSDVTSVGGGFYSGISTQATAFTLLSARAYMAANMTVGAGSTVTTQIGYWSGALSGATNNYAFQGTVAAATGAYNLYMSGTAANYMAGQLLVGTTTLTGGHTALSPTQSTNQYQVSIGGTNTFAGNPSAVLVNTALTGTAATTAANGITVTSAFAIPASGTISAINGINSTTTFNSASTTTSYFGVNASLGFGASALGNTLANAHCFNAASFVINASTTTTISTAAQFVANNIAGTAGSAVTTAIAYRGRQATSNTGVTNNYNLYMDGTADNYLAGRLGVGAFPAGFALVNLGGNSKTPSFGISTTQYFGPTAQSDVTDFRLSDYNPNTAAASFTIGSLQSIVINDAVIGAGSAITSQFGIRINPLTGATNTYAYYSGVAAATGRYNLYMAGTAANYLAGILTIGTTTALGALNVSGGNINNTTTATGSTGYYTGNGTIVNGFSSDYSANVTYLDVNQNFAIRDVQNSYASRLTITSGNITVGGNILITGVGSLGYGTGSGGAVTQATSRTTGVTLNKTNGAITLVSAAGSVTYQSFTVTNSFVAATDTIIVNQKSGTDKYIILITAVAAGSFQITFATTSGITTEQPVFNFAVIKAVVA